MLIHAIPFEDTELSKIKAKKAPVVWSPRSNLSLYGRTMDIEKVLEKKIDVALAPDWTITGSSDMLQELKCAQEYLEANGLFPSKVKPRDMYLMITEKAAKIAGLTEGEKIIAGKLAKDNFADFVVIRRKKDDPFENLLAVTEEDIRLVVINGRPVFGEPKFFRFFSPEDTLDFVQVGNAMKAILLSPTADSGGLYSSHRLSTIQNHLSHARYFAPVLEAQSRTCRISKSR